MQKILVTGGCGYIGSHTMVDLYANGYLPISIDNFSNSDPVVLDQVARITGQDIKNYNVDIKEIDALRGVFLQEKDIAGVIHFAAYKMVGESVLLPLDYYENNVLGQLNLLRCQMEFGIRNHIFSSSCSVYGITDRLPVDEDTPLQEAESPYARTKQINESLIQDFANAHTDYRFTLLRYFNPAGAHHSGLLGESPRNTPQNLVPVITETAIGKRDKLTVFGTDYPTRDGSCIRDYIHVEDLARAHTLALRHLLSDCQKSPVDVYNLGCGNGVSVLEAIKCFEKVSGSKLNYELGERRPGDVISIYADYSKAKKNIGWEPKYDLNAIMETAWKWEQKRDQSHHG